MNETLRSFYRILRLLGIDLIALMTTIRGIPFYLRDFSKIKKQKGYDSSFYFARNYPILHERFANSGIMSGHYFHQDLFVAKRIFELNPHRHVDIGSRTDGFIAHLAVFREVEVFDIRDQKNKIKNIVFRKADLMQLPENMINYCDSISALHSIEHFGLGRYGDPIDYYGHLKAIENITKMLIPGGRFYFSVPIGRQRIEFNAQRIFSIQYLIDLLQINYSIRSFSYVDDMGNFSENVGLKADEIQTNFNCNYGCGIFELEKK